MLQKKLTVHCDDYITLLLSCDLYYSSGTLLKPLSEIGCLEHKKLRKILLHFIIQGTFSFSNYGVRGWVLQCTDLAAYYRLFST